MAEGEGGTPRVVVVTFKKKVPHGVVHWWKGVIKGDETIDVSAIAGRKLNADAATAWRDAHAQFVENAAKRALGPATPRPHPVSVSEFRFTKGDLIYHPL